MYVKIATDSEVLLKNGSVANPVATLADQYGGRCQIIIDDHCYVLLLKRDNGYVATSWIFPEAFEVLKTLPLLTGP